MRTIWGSATETTDLGVVAEQCPRCERPTPCAVRAVCQGCYVFFVKLTAAARETSCRCSVCEASFPCELWRYRALVPAAEAARLSVEDLLARTNPGLTERVQWKQQVSDLGGDGRFAAAYEQLDGMRPGALQTMLRKQLLDWGQLDDEEREALARRIGACARGWQVARHVAPRFPCDAGSLYGLLAALPVWSAFLWAPGVRDWLWGTVTVVAGLAAAGLISNVLLARRVRRWAREVLLPEAQRANVSLPCFFAVVEDLPGTRQHVLDDTWPLKDQVETIRGVLTADGSLRQRVR
jgi:hypothetical protein